MHQALPLLTTLGLASVLTAQFSAEGIEIMPGRISGQTPGITNVIRVVSGTTFPPFEALMLYDARYFQGIGDLRNTTRGKNPASPCEIDTVNLAYQDQQGSTSEPIKIVARGETAKGSRLANTGQAIWTQNIPGWPATTPGGAAIQITVQIMDSNNNRSAIPVPCQESFFFGMEIPALPPNTVWGAPGPGVDGLSITSSSYYLVPGYQLHDWPKGGNTAEYFYDLVVNGARGRFADRMNFGYALVPDSPMLQAGALHQPSTAPHLANEGFGAAGFLPEIDPQTPRGMSSTDGLVMRVTDNNFSPAGLFGIYAALSPASQFSIPPIGLGGLGGGYYLGIPLIPFALITGTTTNVDTLVPMAPPGSIPVSLLGTAVYFQSYVVNGANAHLTNLVGVQY